VGELDALIRQERVNSLWQSGDQVTQEFRCNPFGRLITFHFRQATDAMTLQAAV